MNFNEIRLHHLRLLKKEDLSDTSVTYFPESTICGLLCKSMTGFTSFKRQKHQNYRPSYVKIDVRDHHIYIQEALVEQWLIL